LLQVQIAQTADDFITAAREAEIIFLARKFERTMLMNTPRLKWLHIGGTGVDRLLPLTDFDHISITYTPGLNAAMVADYVMCVMLMLTWNFPRLHRNQNQRYWERWSSERLEGKKICLLGVGNIGGRVAIKAHALGMRVIGVKRSIAPVANVERVVSPKHLAEVLVEADYVVLAMPLTNETRGRIDNAELELMKKTAYLVNVGRGALIQERALIAALRERRIAGAALDVFETEPLPPENELWTLDNVILTPHISSWSCDYHACGTDVFCTNLKRYLSHQPLLQVVDPLVAD
jgi:phosphoglycerate dehydrogenase-like enzyme